MKNRHIVETLSSTPTLLSAWLGSLSEPLLSKTDKKETWNNKNILKHLIYGEQVDWTPRLELMIEKKNEETLPVFTPFDREGHLTNKEEKINILLQQFKLLREDNIRKLISIGDNYELEKLEGVHPDLGKINGLQLISTWAVHDQTHIYQIARNLTSNFVHNVGPWKSYLRIVNQNEYD